MKYIINCETGFEEIREMTDAEIEAEASEVQKFSDFLVELADDEMQRKAERQALLDKLGITAEQARLLLG